MLNYYKFSFESNNTQICIIKQVYFNKCIEKFQKIISSYINFINDIILILTTYINIKECNNKVYL